ncbi:hypothetical protein ASH00_09030 [Arthrobacter sp. Soil782]|uniref:hypothetical protein n=1 Tax=Arthrobacter sp. Soil782 TaxID=1736410 RepID=UPI0006FF1F30|nr:hypothetical protein [Arthrobacter sp. Soil782]KRF05600.1 hypothetical protein ASH00_09030 [Arthrobacter sp. Soil782]
MSTEIVERPAPTEAPCATFHKTAKGEWVILGPEKIVAEGSVTVTLKSGKTKVVNIVDVGKSFEKDGILQRYGYRAKEDKPAPVATAAAPSADESDLDFPPADFVPAPDEEDHHTW